MLKTSMSGTSKLAHARPEAAGPEPLARACAYLEAIGACVLIVGVAVLLV
ncbi:hypothetical protein [Sphingomonas turrisvirgatae]|nr:hypothetical protein [Sphingomonas turrisvirgatae]